MRTGLASWIRGPYRGRLRAGAIGDSPAGLEKLIRGYTREAGVRRLEQMLGRVIRKVAVKFAEGTTEAVTVKGEDVPEMLGPEGITPEQFRKY